MVGQEIAVLRYGHRLVRDYRVTSHCCLVARAFGAKKVIIAGDEDPSIKESVEDITKDGAGHLKLNLLKAGEKH